MSASFMDQRLFFSLTQQDIVAQEVQPQRSELPVSGHIHVVGVHASVIAYKHLQEGILQRESLQR